jgi:NADPH:quinone reductase
MGRGGEAAKEELAMHAVRIHRFGDDSVLRYEEVPDPHPGAGEVRVAVKAASINHGDLARRDGTYPGEVRFPFTLGWEAAGTIDAVGDGVDPQRVGERVAAITNSGSYADNLITAAFGAVPIPAAIDDDVAAAIPVVFLTAWYALVTTAKVQPNEWVLVHAGASGVGMAAIQIAAHRGARVLATASTEAKLDFARRLGAVATINYVDHDFVDEVWHLTDGAGVDVVVESVGGETFEESLDVLRLNGRLITVGNTVGKRAAVDPSALIRNNLSLHGLYLLPWIRSGAAWPALDEIIERVADGTFRVPIDRHFPLQEAGAAHRYIEQRQNIGKVVLHP